MGGGNLCIRLALPVAEAEELLIPIRGGQRVYKRLGIGRGESGQLKVTGQILWPRSVVRAFWHCLLLVGFERVEGPFKCAHATILSTHQIVYCFLHFIREVSKILSRNHLLAE